MSLTFAYEPGLEELDDPRNQRGEIRRIVDGAVAFGQFVGLPVVIEGIIVLPDVVEVFSEGVAQADLRGQRQPLAEQCLDAPQPPRIREGHLAMGGYAGVSRKEFGIDGGGLDEKLLRRGKLTSVCNEFAEKDERFDILRIDGESGPAACLGLDRAPLLAQRQCETQMGRGVIGLQIQRVTVALHRRFHTTHLEEHGA